MKTVAAFIRQLNRQENTPGVKNPYLNPHLNPCAANNLRVYLNAVLAMANRPVLFVGEVP